MNNEQRIPPDGLLPHEVEEIRRQRQPLSREDHDIILSAGLKAQANIYEGLLKQARAENEKLRAELKKAEWVDCCVGRDSSGEGSHCPADNRCLKCMQKDEVVKLRAELADKRASDEAAGAFIWKCMNCYTLNVNSRSTCSGCDASKTYMGGQP